MNESHTSFTCCRFIQLPVYRVSFELTCGQTLGTVLLYEPVLPLALSYEWFYTADEKQLQCPRSPGPYCHKTYRRRFMQEKCAAGRNVIAWEIFKIRIPCNRPTKELIVLFWVIRKCMGQVEVLRMHARWHKKLPLSEVGIVDRFHKN
jgi:hypothetical protein